ncbi:MAG: NUDIX hydrolase [Bacteroidaceae bacterium]|nr:NUDIX hydrolase [Bacteroidaceae bacterium]MBQ7665006.1 NUDIX hydrolase [Bacteroidaceae bacterium]
MELKDKSWTVIETEYLFRRPWLTARRDKLLLPNGKIHPEYYVLEYPDWVNVIAVTKDDDFVLVRQYRHGIRQTCFELVAGVVEQGEAPLDAAKRELLEETGFGGGRWTELMSIAPNASAMTNLSYSFLAVDVEKIDAQHLDETEDIDVYLYPKEKVYDMLSRGEFRQALMVAPLWKYFSGRM